MKINTMSLLFLSVMLMGTSLALSSNSWLGIWMGLEINMISFIPLLKSKNLNVNETSIKYFMVQAIASTMLLFSIMMIQSKSFMNNGMNEIMLYIIMSSLFMKLGAAPFHFWLPEVMGTASWMNCLILMTWQKIAPLSVLSLCMKNSLFICMIIIMSIMMGGLCGINQMSMRQILAYSSMSHIGWMISAMMMKEELWELYFLIYSVMSINVVWMLYTNKMYSINQMFNSVSINKINKLIVMMVLLSLGGLPPFIGFMPKWMVIQSMINEKLTFMITSMIMITTISLYYYLRMMFSMLVLTTTENKWFNTKDQKMKSLSVTSIIVSMGLITSPLILFSL
uniref:NADH-ubiquinone oxidoreductase chain 2 n=1 Tax=Chorotypus fenestratus TaxID=1564101 RepID=A0A0N7AS23_9ORTH|nr:NADH dehydrogenase subunit 2 [Chorotypus fenestratus]